MTYQQLHRIASYLAGNCPFHPGVFSVVEFLILIKHKAGHILSEERIDYIKKWSTSSEQFYLETLNSLVSRPELIEEIVNELRVPGDVFRLPAQKGISHSAQNLYEDLKTIGFITPFDGASSLRESFLQNIVNKNFIGWKIKKASLKTSSENKYLWESIEAFLERYPIYIADIRDNNLSVALEVGYLLKSKTKNLVLILNDTERFTDLKGFIRIPHKKNDSIAGSTEEEASRKQKEINELLEKDIIEQLSRFIGEVSR